MGSAHAAVVGAQGVGQIDKKTLAGMIKGLEAFDSSVWVRRNGKWVCALHTESPDGDPYGRH